MADSTPSVLSEIVAGDALGLSAAARLLPAHRGEGRVCASTIWRWIKTGTRTSDGRVVKLEAARIGTRWLTSQAALTRYMTALTPVTPEATSPAPAHTAVKQRSEHNASMKKLHRKGRHIGVK